MYDEGGFAAELADMTLPKWFQKKESPLKVTNLWVEVQKLFTAFFVLYLNKIDSVGS